MNTYEKVTALIVRLISLGFILHSCLLAILLLLSRAPTSGVLFPIVIAGAGIGLFRFAIPVARLFASGIDH
ncbi:hypothetical protein [Haloferula sargassicola]|uniref:hypothetical protein n=1 Tax=Haloferula sargassicola TaxID=490096 RepID=UPI0033658629